MCASTVAKGIIPQLSTVYMSDLCVVDMLDVPIDGVITGPHRWEDVYTMDGCSQGNNYVYVLYSTFIYLCPTAN